MVFDPAPVQSFPFVQAFFGGFFLWLGLNLEIQFVKKEDQTED